MLCCFCTSTGCSHLSFCLVPRKTCPHRIKVGERGPGERKNLFITVRISNMLLNLSWIPGNRFSKTTSASCHGERVCLLPLAAHCSLKSWWWRQPPRLLRPWDSPGKNTGVGCHALLQGMFAIQGSNHRSLTSLALAGRFFAISATWEAHSF